MSEIRTLIQQIPTEQIAAQVGASPEETQRAINTLVPTLMAGLQANAQDPAGEASLLRALEDHDGSLVEGGVDPSAVDTQDGAKIAQHIFGPNEDQVVQRLSGAGGGSSSLLQKLLPILAPIVLSFVVSQLTRNMGGGQPQSAPQQGGGGLGDILGSILGGGGAAQQAPAPQPQQHGGGLGDILGSILGAGGQAQPAPQQPAPSTPAQTQPGGTGMPSPANTEPMPGGLRGPHDVPQQQREQTQHGGGLGDILGGVLGGLLGGGSR